MKEQRHTEEQNDIRADSLKESQRQGVFVDEFGQANPHVGTGSCRPATKGKLAEPLKREVATDFIDVLTVGMGKKFIKIFQKLEKKHGRVIALQLIDDQLTDIIIEEFRAEMRCQVQRIYEWFGEEKPEWHKDVIDQIGTPDGQYPSNKE